MKYVLFAFCSLIFALSAPATEATRTFGEFGTEFLQQHCIDCHSGDAPEGELSLTEFTTNASLILARSKWDSILQMVDTGVMPPADFVQPAPDRRRNFIKLVRDIFEEHGPT